MCGLRAAPSPAGGRGKEAAAERGGGGAGSLGRAATPRSPRPPPAVCAAGHGPVSRSRGFTAQESRALPSHGGSRVALPLDRGSGRMRAEEGWMSSGWCGAAAAPPDRAKLLPCSQQPGLAFYRLSLRITAGGNRREGSLPCRRGGRGHPAVVPAGRRRLQPRPPARAAVALLPPLQPPPHRKEQREK